MTLQQLILLLYSLPGHIPSTAKGSQTQALVIAIGEVPPS